MLEKAVRGRGQPSGRGLGDWIECGRCGSAGRGVKTLEEAAGGSANLNLGVRILRFGWGTGKLWQLEVCRAGVRGALFTPNLLVTAFSASNP